MSRMSKHRFESDGSVISESFIDDDGILHGRKHANQKERNDILRRNKKLRNEPDKIRHLGSMGLEMQIPKADFYYLTKKYPALKSVDQFERSLAWKKFMKSPESDPYRVRYRKT